MIMKIMLKNEKIFKNLLTNRKKCDIIYKLNTANEYWGVAKW